MRIRLVAAGLATAALFALPANAFAACTSAGTSAEVQANNQVVEDAVARTKTDPDTGDVEASTGAAKPTESWMGCPPDNDEPGCRTTEGVARMKQEAKESNARAGSGESGEIDSSADLQARAGTPAEACEQDKTTG